MAVSILRFLFISAVAVRAAGGQRVLPHKVRHAAGLAHGVVQMAHGRREIVKSQLPHKRADAALRKPPFVAAAVRVFDKVHVPRVGVAVGRLSGGGGFHSGNILGCKL